MCFVQTNKKHEILISLSDLINDDDDESETTFFLLGQAHKHSISLNNLIHGLSRAIFLCSVNKFFLYLVLNLYFLSKGSNYWNQYPGHLRLILSGFYFWLVSRAIFLCFSYRSLTQQPPVSFTPTSHYVFLSQCQAIASIPTSHYVLLSHWQKARPSMNTNFSLWFLISKPANAIYTHFWLYILNSIDIIPIYHILLKLLIIH